MSQLVIKFRQQKIPTKEKNYRANDEKEELGYKRIEFIPLGNRKGKKSVEVRFVPYKQQNQEQIERTPTYVR